MNQIVELSCDEVEMVTGGIIPVVVYAAFVSGAKWGAGIALATYAIHAKYEN